MWLDNWYCPIVSVGGLRSFCWIFCKLREDMLFCRHRKTTNKADVIKVVVTFLWQQCYEMEKFVVSTLMMIQQCMDLEVFFLPEDKQENSK